MFCFTEPDQALLIKLRLTLTSGITESWEMVLNMQGRLVVCQWAGRSVGYQGYIKKLLIKGFESL